MNLLEFQVPSFGEWVIIAAIGLLFFVRPPPAFGSFAADTDEIQKLLKEELLRIRDRLT